MENIPFTNNVSFYKGSTKESLSNILQFIDAIEYADDDLTRDVLKSFVTQVYDMLPETRSYKNEHVPMNKTVVVSKDHIGKNHWMTKTPTGVYNSISTFIQSLIRRNFTPNNLVVVNKKGQKVAIEVTSAYGTKAQVYLMPKRISGSNYLKDAFTNARAFIKAKYLNMESFNKDMNKLPLMHLINANKEQIIKDSTLLNFFTSYLDNIS